MKRVQLLDENVIKKIAAGEVVERPASVVKELVENALDAGSQRISIDLEEGGKKLIRISDDGSGIMPEDCLVALQRHATSKITHQDDLFAIQTLGFRGEALAAISSIAEFSLCSRVRGASVGTKVTVEDDEPTMVPWSGADGTIVTVAKLFCRVPVRLKFLKSDETEFAQCHDLVQALALANPSVGFSLTHNGKKRFSASPLIASAEDAPWRGEAVLRERWKLVAGAEDAEAALYVREENAYGRWEALISPPGRDKATNKHMVHFVNGRWVKDKVLNFGVLRGYHSHLMKGRHPQVLSFLDCDPSLIDVNVHPAKTELRFQYAGEVQGLMSYAIRRALRMADWSNASLSPLEQTEAPSSRAERSGAEGSPTLSFVSPSAEAFDLRPPGYAGDPSTAPQAALRMTGSSRGLWEAPRRPDSFHRSFDSSPRVERGDLFSSSRAERSDMSPLSRAERSVAEGSPTLNFVNPSIETSAHTLPKDWGLTLEHLTYVGTFAKCYVLYEKDDKLLVIDQHAFHERILYERLCQKPQLLSERQVLMMPEAITLDAELVLALQEHKTVIQSAGFDINVLDATNVEIRAIPTLLVNKRFDAFLLEFVQKLADGSIDSAQHIHHDILATMACHAAVRAGEELSEEELRLLLREAQSVDFYHNCPHGRRVFKWFPKSDVAGWFDR